MHDDNTKVEKLTEDESSQVNRVPTKQGDKVAEPAKAVHAAILMADPLLEVLDEPVLRLLHVLDIPVPGASPKVFHQPTLEVKPYNPAIKLW